MNATDLQRWVDEIVDATTQQWAFRLLAVATAVASVLAGTAATGRSWPAGVFVVAALALASAIRPDSHISMIVVAIAVVYWSTSVDRLDTAWLAVASVCLLVHHAVTALSATVPTGGDIPWEVIRRWLGRTALGGLLTVTTWGLVVLFDRRDAAGNGLLTGLALAVVAAAAVIVRARSIDHS